MSPFPVREDSHNLFNEFQTLFVTVFQLGIVTAQCKLENLFDEIEPFIRWGLLFDHFEVIVSEQYAANHRPQDFRKQVSRKIGFVLRLFEV